jgi:hypothetical protein
MPDVPEEDVITDVISRLEVRFPQTSPTQIVAAVKTAEKHYENARIRDYVPVFIEREARAALEQVAVG